MTSTNTNIVEHYRWARVWLREMWSHHFRAKRSPIAHRTNFWKCIEATIAILLCREGEYKWDGDWTEVAWQERGTYWTDYGTGRAWETLLVSGFRFTTFEDGNL